MSVSKFVECRIPPGMIPRGIRRAISQSGLDSYTTELD
jgi:hypothetical protein